MTPPLGNDRPILITGSQRSGTSMVAGILFHLGVFLGHWFLKRDKYNPLGYFEDMDFGKLDNQRFTKEITKEQWEEQFKELSTKRRTENIPSFVRNGWKTPSASDHIQDIIRLANPQIVWCKRNRDDTLESMNKMFWQGEEAKKMYDSKVKGMEDIKSCIVDFDSLLDNTEYEIGRLAGWLNLNPSQLAYKKALRHVIKKPITNEVSEESYQEYL